MSICRPFKWMPWPWCLEAYTTTWNLDSMHPHLLGQEPGSRLKAFESNGSQNFISEFQHHESRFVPLNSKLFSTYISYMSVSLQYSMIFFTITVNIMLIMHVFTIIVFILFILNSSLMPHHLSFIFDLSCFISQISESPTIEVLPELIHGLGAETLDVWRFGCNHFRDEWKQKWSIIVQDKHIYIHIIFKIYIHQITLDTTCIQIWWNYNISEVVILIWEFEIAPREN